MDSTYDVIVFGGGTAGTVAAIQSARAGVRTLLVERTGMLGGTITVGGINGPAHFFAWGKQIIAGIGWELVCRTYEETGHPIPTPDYTRDIAKPRHIGVDRAVYAAVCDEAVIDAGVDLLFHAMPAEIERNGENWIVTICTKTGLQQTSAKVLIDCTGDANAVELAGYDVIRTEIQQPATLSLNCSGFDFDSLDMDAINRAAEAAIAAGELVSTDISWSGTTPASFLRSRGSNANHVKAPAAETSEGRTVAEVEGRRAVMRAYRFLKKQPGLENIRLDWIAPETGIRETVTIRGKYQITVQDYESGRRFEDAICNAFYPVDEHLHDGKGINQRVLGDGLVPTIPRRALLPADSQFLIVAGRCLASDREANSALRVQVPCMAMGQAAGAMAVLSAERGIDPEELPMAEVHALLREHGAVEVDE